MAIQAPHPIPYQGSKRRLAQTILGYYPAPVNVLFEPFVGSAAVTIATAARDRAVRYHCNDVLQPLMGIWEAILENPMDLADEYRRLWREQLDSPKKYFFQVREEYNADGSPAKLLYLLARCVKNSVRFNSNGQFNQSPDNRRLGMKPDKLRTQVLGAHQLLKGCTTLTSLDYEEVLQLAEPGDLVYMDPPYQGTSNGRDRRYYESLDVGRFVGALERLRQRRVPFIISFDGRLGDKTYGQELPRELGLTRVEVNAGRSSQATLNGKSHVTFESLYLSPELANGIVYGTAVSCEEKTAEQPRLL